MSQAAKTGPVNIVVFFVLRVLRPLWNLRVASLLAVNQNVALCILYSEIIGIHQYVAHVHRNPLDFFDLPLTRFISQLI